MAKKAYVTLKLKDEFSKPVDKADKAVKKYKQDVRIANQKLKDFSTSMRKGLATACKTASVALTAAAAAGGKLVKDTMEHADTIDKMSQKIGVSRQAYQELDFVMSQCGASVEGMKMGMKTLTTQMQSASTGNKTAQETFRQLGVSVTDSTGKLRNQEDVMWDAMKALQSMDNQTEKAALANKLFGRSGAELMPLLNSSSASIEDLRKKAHELGLVMADDTVDAGVQLTDTLDQAKRALQNVGYTIGGELIPYVQEAGELLIKNLPKIKEAAGKAGEMLKKVANILKWVYNNTNIVIPVVATFVTVLGGLKIISAITNMVNLFKGAMAAYQVVQSLVNVTMLACPLGWIAAIMAVAVGAGIALYKNWDKICAWAKRLKDKLSNLLNPIKRVGDGLKKLFGFNGKTVNVNVNETKTTGGSNKTGHKALGTSYWKGGRTEVNERGGEIIDLPSGSRVIPADKSEKMLSGGNVTVNLTVQGNVIGNQAFMEQMGSYLTGKIKTAMSNV